MMGLSSLGVGRRGRVQSYPISVVLDYIIIPDTLAKVEVVEISSSKSKFPPSTFNWKITAAYSELE